MPQQATSTTNMSERITKWKYNNNCRPARMAPGNKEDRSISQINADIAKQIQRAFLCPPSFQDQDQEPGSEMVWKCDENSNLTQLNIENILPEDKQWLITVPNDMNSRVSSLERVQQCTLPKVHFGPSSSSLYQRNLQHPQYNQNWTSKFPDKAWRRCLENEQPSSAPKSDPFTILSPTPIRLRGGYYNPESEHRRRVMRSVQASLQSSPALSQSRSSPYSGSYSAATGYSPQQPRTSHRRDSRRDSFSSSSSGYSSSSSSSDSYNSPRKRKPVQDSSSGSSSSDSPRKEQKIDGSSSSASHSHTMLPQDSEEFEPPAWTHRARRSGCPSPESDVPSRFSSPVREAPRERIEFNIDDYDTYESDDDYSPRKDKGKQPASSSITKAFGKSTDFDIEDYDLLESDDERLPPKTKANQQFLSPSRPSSPTHTIDPEYEASLLAELRSSKDPSEILTPSEIPTSKSTFDFSSTLAYSWLSELLGELVNVPTVRILMDIQGGEMTREEWVKVKSILEREERARVDIEVLARLLGEGGDVNGGE